jgi:hypothetical protein
MGLACVASPARAQVTQVGFTSGVSLLTWHSELPASRGSVVEVTLVVVNSGEAPIPVSSWDPCTWTVEGLPGDLLPLHRECRGVDSAVLHPGDSAVSVVHLEAVGAERVEAISVVSDAGRKLLQGLSGGVYSLSDGFLM